MTDYTRAKLSFRIRKAWRYLWMYGPRRTLSKVRAQYHMRRRFDVMPDWGREPDRHHVIGLLGCGKHAYSSIAYFLTREFGYCIRACMDINPHRAASLAHAFRIPIHGDDPSLVLDDPNIALVYIASNHASHADYAIAALRRGKSVFVEKPHAVSMDQLTRLVVAARESEGDIFLGFNRPSSRFGLLIESHLARESGSSIINWFVAGHKIDPGHWYFRPSEGGRVLGNLCHWIDFTLQIAGSEALPVEIVPARHDQSDSNIAVSYVFANGTIGAITFSAKGHAFEGVMERLAIHRGNLLLTMSDYRTMTVREGPEKTRYFNWLRDHGHKQAITAAAMRCFDPDISYDRKQTIRRMSESGTLMLMTKKALETQTTLTVQQSHLP